MYGNFLLVLICACVFEPIFLSTCLSTAGFSFLQYLRPRCLSPTIGTLTNHAHRCVHWCIPTYHCTSPTKLMLAADYLKNTTAPSISITRHRGIVKCITKLNNCPNHPVSITNATLVDSHTVNAVTISVSPSRSDQSNNAQNSCKSSQKSCISGMAKYC